MTGSHTPCTDHIVEPPEMWEKYDRIVWFTGYSHWDSDYPQASTEFLALDLDDETRRKILWDNYARLYGF